MSEHHRRTGRGHWAQIRRRALERDGRRCRECGKAGRLEVHHALPLERGGNNDMANLLTLCRDCHLRAHRRPATPAQSEWDRMVAELE